MICAVQHPWAVRCNGKAALVFVVADSHDYSATGREVKAERDQLPISSPRRREILSSPSHKDARMYPRSLLRLATLALAVSPTLGAPSVFAIGEITPLAATEATVLRTSVARCAYVHTQVHIRESQAFARTAQTVMSISPNHRPSASPRSAERCPGASTCTPVRCS